MLINFLSEGLSGSTTSSLSYAHSYKSSSTVIKTHKHKLEDIFFAHPKQITILSLTVLYNDRGGGIYYDSEYAYTKNVIRFYDSNDELISANEYRGKRGQYNNDVTEENTLEYVIDVPENAVYIEARSEAFYRLTTSIVHIVSGMFVKSIEVDDGFVVTNVPRLYCYDYVIDYVAEQDITADKLLIHAHHNDVEPVNIGDNLYKAENLVATIDGEPFDFTKPFTLKTGQNLVVKSIKNAPAVYYSYAVFKGKIKGQAQIGIKEEIEYNLDAMEQGFKTLRFTEDIRRPDRYVLNFDETDKPVPANIDISGLGLTEFPSNKGFFNIQVRNKGEKKEAVIRFKTSSPNDYIEFDMSTYRGSYGNARIDLYGVNTSKGTTVSKVHKWELKEVGNYSLKLTASNDVYGGGSTGVTLQYVDLPAYAGTSESSLLPLNENVFDREVTNGNAELSLKQTIYAKEKPELALLLQEKACAQDGASLSLKERILISDKSDLELQEKIYIKSQKDLKIKENAYMGGHSKLTLNQTIYAPEKAQLNLKERIQESIKTSLSIKEIIYTQEKTLLSLKERCAISKNVSLPLKETVTSSSSNPLNLQVGWNVIPKAETPILKNAYIEKFNDDYIFFRNGKVYDIQNDKLYDNIVAFNYFKDEYTGQEVFWSYDYMALRTPNGEITQIEKARTNVIFAYRDNQIFAYSSNVITKYKVIFSEDGSSFELDYSDQSLKQLVIELSKDFKVMESAFYGDDILIFDRYNRETVYKINIFTQEVQTFTTQWQSYKDITPYEHCNLFLVDALYKDTAYIIGRYYDTTQMIDLKTLEVIKTIKYGVTQEVFDFYVADEHIFLYNSSLVRTKHLLDTSHKYEDGVGNDYCNGGVSSSFAYFCVQDSDKGETRIFVPRIEKRKKAITLALKENIVQQDAIFENVKLPLKQTVYGQSAPESALTVQEKVYAQNQIDFAIKESVIVSGKANLSLKQNIFAEPSGSAKLSIKEDIRRSEYYYVYHCDTEHPHDLPSTINLSGLFNLDSYIQNDVIKAVAVSHSKARGYFTFETFAPNARLTIEADYIKSSPEMRAGVMAYIDDSENLGYAGIFIVEKPGKHRFKFEVINEADYGTIVYMINRMIIPYMPDGPLGFNVFKLKETIDFSGLEEEGNAKLSLKERACAMWGEEFRVRERIINTAKTQLSLKEKVILGNYQTLVMYERTKAKDKAQLNLKVNAISANSKALTLKETIQAQDKQTLTLNLTIYAKEKQVLSLKQKIIVQEARNLALKERIVLEANQTLALKEKAVKSGFKALKLKSYIIAEQSQDSLTLKETIKAPSKSTLTLQEKAIEQAKQTLNVKENIESLTGFGALSLKERVIVTDKALLDIQEKIYGFKSKTLSMQELIKQEGAQTVYVVEKVVFPFIPLVETILLDGYRTRLLSSNKPIALLNRKERKQ